MEIIERDEGPRDGLVKVAFAETREEARRIYVRPDDATAARKLLAETIVEDPLPEEIPEPASVGYLADRTARRPRDYTVLGAYVRGWIVALAVLPIAFVLFLLLH